MREGGGGGGGEEGGQVASGKKTGGDEKARIVLPGQTVVCLGVDCGGGDSQMMDLIGFNFEAGWTGEETEMEESQKVQCGLFAVRKSKGFWALPRNLGRVGLRV